MADARILHKRGANGQRVIGLDDLSFRVWVQYVLSADDYGVMRGTAAAICVDNERLGKEPPRRLSQAMRAVVESTLVQTFEHQSLLYWWQADWQDFQGVTYPRDTIHPAPPAEALALATIATRQLFSVHHLSSKERAAVLKEYRRNKSASFPGTILGTDTESVLETDTGTVHVRARGRAREIQLHTQLQTDPGSDRSEEIPISTAQPEPAWGHRRRAQPLVVNHPGCDVVTAAACARGFCVPKFYPSRWRQQIDPERRDLAGTDAHIRQVVVYGLERLPAGGAIGGTKPEKFWGDVWEEFHAQNAPRAVGSGSRPADKSAQVDAAVEGALAIIRQQKAVGSGRD